MTYLGTDRYGNMTQRRSLPKHIAHLKDCAARWRLQPNGEGMARRVESSLARLRGGSPSGARRSLV